MSRARQASLPLDRRLAAYTLAGGAVLAAADPAQAQTQYSGLQNLLVGTNTTVPLDLNGDLVPEFSITNRPSTAVPPVQELVVTANAMDAILGTKSGTPERQFASALAAGTLIGPTPPTGTDYRGGDSVMRDAIGAGDWTPDGQPRFLGARFDIAPGSQHFAWIRVTVNPDLTAVVNDWAYDNNGVAVVAGVPEPSSLALLAVGSAAGGIWARRRKAAAAVA